MTHQAEISHVKSLHQETILAKPNVLGVGIGYKVRGRKETEELCVIALVRQKIPLAGLAPEALVPKEVDGISTDVLQVGHVRAFASRTDRWRPIPGGVSVGHFKITAGTLGCVVRDRDSGDRLMLSNNHVLANSNQAQQGDPILQPGPADGGRVETDTVAGLMRYVPIQFQQEPPTCGLAMTVATIANLAAKLLGSQHRLEVIKVDPEAVNVADAAVAKPVNGVELMDEILDIGVVGGTTPAKLGMQVRKSGRSTGFTSGRITVLDATLNVNYGDRVARFEDQIVTTAMSSPGDSGSLLVAGDSLLAVGLLFAGSSQATIYNPIQRVLDALKVVL
jgi:hypothetical protein